MLTTKKLCWIFTVILCVALLGCEAASQKPGGVAPEIEVKGWLNTEPLTLASLKGKVVVVEFWATWCPPCRTSIPHLATLYKKHKGADFALISITNEPKEQIADFAKKAGMIWPVGCGSTTSSKYGVSGIPHAFVVDRKGEIVWRGHPMSGLEQAVEKALSVAK